MSTLSEGKFIGGKVNSKSQVFELLQQQEVLDTEMKDLITQLSEKE